MAHNPCETWHPFQFDTNRDISFIAKPNPDIIQHADVNIDKLLFENKKSDFKYLHSHPEIKGVILFVLSELVKHNPLYIKKFCSELFQHYNGECLRQIIEGIVQQKIVDNDSSSSSESSITDEIVEHTDSTGSAVEQF